METTGKIQLNITSESGDVVVRTGEALKLHPPQKLTISGLITSAADFFIMRKELINVKGSHVIVNREMRTITLVVDETNILKTDITGALRYNKELADFGINKTKMFTLKELTQLFRMKRMHFIDKAEHSKTLAELNKFFAKITTEIKDHDDRKGNSEKSIKKETETNSPLSFKLEISIYEGQPVKKIFVDVLADVSDAQAKFWLESVDLIELEHGLTNEIIDKEIERFNSELVVFEV